jgi:hypothetical protein
MDNLLQKSPTQLKPSANMPSNMPPNGSKSVAVKQAEPHGYEFAGPYVL